MKRFTTILAATALLLLAGTANAGLITFEEVPQTSGATPSTQGDITSGGYLFNSSTNHTHFVNNFSGGNSGSTFFGADDFAGANTVTMTESGGAAFNLNSLDLGNWFEQSTNLLLTGTLFGGGTVSSNIALGAFSNFALNWTNLISVSFDSTAGTDDQYWGVDNISVSAVPEPSILILLSTCLLMLGIGRRTRRSSVAG